MENLSCVCVGLGGNWASHYLLLYSKAVEYQQYGHVDIYISVETRNR